MTGKTGSQKSSQTAVSAFGSITALMSDGMTIALSQFGDSGVAPDGKFRWHDNSSISIDIS